MKTPAKTMLIATALAGGIAAAGVHAAPPWGAAGYGYGPGAAAPGGRSAGAGRHCLDPEARMERMAERLDLTPEQRAQVRAIIDKYRPQRRELREQLADNRKQLRALLAQGNASEAEVRKLADAQGRLVADLIVQRSKLRSEIHALLTPQQREKLQQRLEQHGHSWGTGTGGAAEEAGAQG